MRKKLLLNLLDDANGKIQLLKNENEMYKQRVIDLTNKYENDDTAKTLENKIDILQKDNAELNEKISQLLETIEKNEAEYLKNLTEKDKTIETQKGELFDIKKENEALKIKSDASNDTEKIPVPKKVLPKKPEIHNIPDITENSEAYDYASSVISKVIIKSATVKTQIAMSNVPIAEELLTLILGKIEIFKSSILQIAVNDSDIENKKADMDKAATETEEYLDGVLGQVSNK